MNPLAWSSLARDAEMIPFPKDEVTPPVTKMYLAEADMERSQKNSGAKVGDLVAWQTSRFFNYWFLRREGLHAEMHIRLLWLYSLYIKPLF